MRILSVPSARYIAPAAAGNVALFNFQNPNALTERSGTGSVGGDADVLSSSVDWVTPTTDGVRYFPSFSDSSLVCSFEPGSLSLTGDWTIDLIFAVASGFYEATIFDMLGDSNNGWRLRVQYSSPFRWLLDYYNSGSLETVELNSGSSAYEMRHMRLSMSGGTLRLFLGGVLADSVAATSPDAATPPNMQMLRDFVGGAPLWIFSVRIIDGTALSTTDDSFTPPTVPLTWPV